MKYAFIALIAIYLIIYGCSPDKTEKAKETHKESVQTTVKDSHDSEKAAVAVEHQKPADAAQQEAKVVAHKTAEPVPPVAKEQQPAQVAESEQVTMPCGRVMTKADIAENAPPCLKMQTPEVLDTAATAGTEQALEAALQQVVKTTNEMVLATRQLVLTTQEILKASKKTAEETQPAEHSAAGKEAAPAQQ